MTRSVSCWEDMRQIAESLRSRGWLFRGQSDPWPLRPPAGRLGGDPCGAGLRPDDERGMLDEFKRRARLHLREGSRGTDQDWLHMAAQHGLPTRLLSWSRDPYVAIFFALQAGAEGRLPHLYALPPLARCGAGADPFALDGPRCMSPCAPLPHHWAQRLIYTVHPDPHTPFHPEGLRAWVLPARGQALAALRSNLAQLGYRPARLMPDLRGIAGDIALSAELRLAEWVGKPEPARKAAAQKSRTGSHNDLTISQFSNSEGTAVHYNAQ